MTHPVMVPARRPRRESSEPATWRERVAGLRYVPPLVRLVWRTHRAFTTTMIALRAIRAFVPVVALWIGKQIIDGVLAARGGAPIGNLWRWVLLELAVVVVGEALARASSLVESLLGDLFSNRMSVRLMEHAATLDLAQFEDPVFYDHLERARRQTTGRLGLLAQVLSLAQDALTLVTLSAALLAFSVWLFALLVVATLP